MDDAERREIEWACERLVVRYCHLVDHGEAARMAELFTEDAVWASPEVTLTGMGELEAGFRHRQSQRERMSRHVCTNLLLEVQDADHATGCVYLTLYRHDGDPARAVSPLAGPELVGEYRDTFRRTPAGWRFSRRELHVSFVRPADG